MFGGILTTGHDVDIISRYFVVFLKGVLQIFNGTRFFTKLLDGGCFNKMCFFTFFFTISVLVLKAFFEDINNFTFFTKLIVGGTLNKITFFHVFFHGFGALF